MQWNADMYQDKHSFVSEYGQSLLGFVNKEPGQIILDVGCGTGELTEKLAADGAKVIGMDLSKNMIEKAKKAHPGPEFFMGDATEIPYSNYFDTVFSNAVFHWIPNQRKLIDSVRRALKAEGLLVCEFGASGNIQAIQNSFCRQLRERGLTYRSPFVFPEGQEYRRMMESEGMTVRHLLEYDRPTPLSDSEKGLRNWVVQFFAEDLRRLPSEEQERLLCGMEEELRTDLWDNTGKRWIADYRRIQIVAAKTE